MQSVLQFGSVVCYVFILSRSRSRTWFDSNLYKIMKDAKRLTLSINGMKFQLMQFMPLIESKFQ